MFSGLIRKIQSIILPIFFILFTFIIIIYFSFTHIIRDDYVKKSHQFSRQISKNFSLQLESIQKITDTMLKKYHINNIDIESDSKIAITKAISCFVLYNPNITGVHLLKDDSDFLSSATKLFSPLSNDYNYASYDKCWFYSKTYDSMVYTQALSGDLTHIAVMFDINSAQLLPQTYSPFSDITEIYAVADNKNICNILKSSKKKALSSKQILSIASSDKHPNGIYKSNRIYRATNTSHSSIRIVSVQSADYIFRQFLQIIIFLIVYLAVIMLLCIISIRKISCRISVSLETLNKKFRTGIMQIDELVSCLK